ncbi:MAG: ABC transporter substrate-binding protein [Dehalococcoidia bacterium]
MAQERDYWQRFWQGRLSRRRVLKGAALGSAGLAAAAVIGCGGEEEKAAPPAATPTAPPAATATPGPAATAAPTPAATAAPTPAAAQPVRGGTIAVTEAGDPPGLDPFRIGSYLSHDVSSGVYDRLLKYKSGPTGDVYNSFTLMPNLAAEWEVVDLQTYRFTLKDNAKWQNLPPLNGRKVTAEDIRLSMGRFMDSEISIRHYLFAHVESIQTPDEQTIVFKLKEPDAWFPNVNAYNNNIRIMPAKEELEGKIDFGEKAVGSGPWILEEWEPNVAIRFRANTDYHEMGIDNKPIPYADRLDYLFMRETAPQVAQLRAGKLDWVNRYAMDVQTAKALDGEGFQVITAVDPGNSGISFPTAFPDWKSPRGGVATYDPNSPYNDVRMRRAVSLAVDRKALAQIQDEGKAIMSLFLTPAFTQYRLDPAGPEMAAKGLDKWFKHDPAEAKKLMEAAGYGGGTPAWPVYASNRTAVSGSARALLEAWVEMVNQVGIKLQIQFRDHNTEYISHDWRGELKEALLNWGTGGKGVLFEFLRDTFTRGGIGHFGIMDDRMEDMISGLRVIVDEEERIKRANEFDLYMAEKMYMVPAISRTIFWAIAPTIENVHVQTWFNDLGEAYPYWWQTKT